MISFRGVAETAYMFSATSIQTDMPTEAQVGDLALAFYIEDTGSSSTIDAGWTALYTGAAGGNTTVMAWSKTVEAADIGAPVTVSSQNTGNLRRNLHVVVYAEAAVADSAQAEESGGNITTHTAPSVNSTDGDSWVVNFFADRASPASSDFTLSGNLTERSALYSDGSNGTVSSIVGDDANVGTGAVGANTVTGTTATDNANSSTVLLVPVVSPLTVSAGTNQTVTPNVEVTLHGSATGGTGSYEYDWGQLSGPTVDIGAAQTADLTFTAPATVGAEMVFELEVYDGQTAETNTVAVKVDSAQLLSERFNGGTDGESITSANSAFDQASGTVTSDDSWSITGSSARFDTGTGSRAALEATMPAAAKPWLRWYHRLDSIPAANTYIASARAGSVQQADVRLNADGTLSIRDGFTAVDTSSTAITAGAAVRLAWRPNADASTQTLHIYAGENIHATEPTETLSGSYSGEPVSRVQLGVVASPPDSYVCHIDDVVFDAVAEPGPSVSSNLDVSAGSDRAVRPGDKVTLTATASGGTTPYSYSWSQTAGDSVSYTQSGPSLTFATPQTSGVLTFTVTVTDAVSGQAYDEINLNARPPFTWSAVGGVWVPRKLRSAIDGTFYKNDPQPGGDGLGADPLGTTPLGE